jgi:hypothetical protein
MHGRWSVAPSVIAMFTVSHGVAGCGPTVVLPQADGTETGTATASDEASSNASADDRGPPTTSGDETGRVDTGVLDTGVLDTGVADTGVAETTDGGDDETTAGVTTATTDGGEESTGTTGAPERCEAPTKLVTCDADTDDPFAAIGLGCPGGPDDSIAITNATFASDDPNAWAIAPQLGNAVDPATGEQIWGPTEGDALLVLSTGHVAMIESPAFAYLEDVNDNENPDDKPLPPPMSALPGSNGGAGGTPYVGCDGVGDCGETIVGMSGDLASDLLWMQLETQVPAGTHGFTLDFAYFTEEWPDYVGTYFEDALVVWSNSESYTGNVCILDDGACTMNNLWPPQYHAGSPELASTGFGSDGGTAWHRIRGSATPGETLQLTIAVFEMAGTMYDMLVVLDRFAWECDGCDPLAGECGAALIGP